MPDVKPPVFWIEGSIKAPPEKVHGNIEMLNHAAIHCIASYILNKSKPECYSEPVSVVHSIMEIKSQIEDEIEYLKSDQKAHFHSIKEKT